MEFEGKQLIQADHLRVPIHALRINKNKSLVPNRQKPSLADIKYLLSNDSALNGDRMEKIAKQALRKKKKAVVYASQKFVGQKELTQNGITFCGLPYGILK